MKYSKLLQEVQNLFNTSAHTLDTLLVDQDKEEVIYDKLTQKEVDYLLNKNEYEFLNGRVMGIVKTLAFIFNEEEDDVYNKLKANSYAEVEVEDLVKYFQTHIK